MKRSRPRTANLLIASYAILEGRLLLAQAGNWDVRSPGGGGALFAPAINPHDPAEMYVQSDMSQVFRTRDGGASWKTLDFARLGGGSRAVVRYTSDPAVLYALDAALVDSMDATVPVRSNDGGETWTRINDPADREAFYLFADYAQPSRVIVSDWTRMFLSVDGGATWSLKYTAPAADGLHLGGAFFDGADIYVGTNHGLLRSSNGGTSFQMTPLAGFAAGEDLVTMAGARDGNTVRLFAIAQSVQVWGGYKPENWYGFSNLYRWEPGQAAWTSATAGLPADAKPFFVDMARNNVNAVYVAGNTENGLPLIYKSTNGGQQWSDVFRWQNNQNIATGWQGQGGHINWWWGAGALGFAVSPVNAAQALVTDYGFAHYSDDGGNSWRNVNVVPADLNPAGSPTSTTRPYHTSGLGNTAIWNLTWLDQQTLLAGFSDIEMAISRDGGRGWSFDHAGLGQNSLYRAVVHPQTGVIYAATSTIHDLYETTRTTDSIIDPGTGRVMYSANGGRNWQVLRDFGRVVRWVELDPANPQRMYVSVVHSVDGGIYVTDNLNAGPSATWRRLTAPPRTEGHPYNIRILADGTLLTTWSARQPGAGGGNFTASSGVFTSHDGGATWQDRTDPRMRYWTMDVTVDPHDPSQSTWYAGVYSGWGGPANDLGGLYRTTDRGQTWTRFYQSHRVTSATVHPVNPDELYIATETEGLIYSGNRRAAQPAFSRVAGMDFRHPLQVHFNPWNSNEVWVTTFGGQLWVGTTPEPQPGGTYSLTEGKLTLQGSGPAQVIRATRDGTSYRFSLQGGTWSGASAAGITGMGTANLLISRALLDGLAGGLLVRGTAGSLVDLLLTGNADFSALSGIFATSLSGDIAQAAAAVVNLGRAALAGREIRLEGSSNRFGPLTLEGNSAVVTAVSDLLLAGTGNTGSLTLRATGRIGNLPGTSLSVTGNLYAGSSQRIDLARNAADSLQVGGSATFGSGIQPLVIGDLGQAAFGSLWINAAGYARIRETGDMRIGRLISSGSVQLTATGGISDGVQARVEVRYGLALSAGSWIVLADSAADSWIAEGLVELQAGTSVHVMAAGFVQFGQLRFNASAVTVQADSRIHLAGSSRAGWLKLATPDVISDAAGVSVEVTASAGFVARGVLLADQAADRLRICPHLRLDVTDFAWIQAPGDVEIGSVWVTPGVWNSISIDRTC